MHELKLKYEHIRDKQFYLRVDDEYTIHLILGDNTFSRIKTKEVIKGAKGDPTVEDTTFGYSRVKTKEVIKGAKGDPTVEDTTFGYIIHGGDKGSGTCMYMSDTKDYKALIFLGWKIGVRMIHQKFTKSL